MATGMDGSSHEGRESTDELVEHLWRLVVTKESDHSDVAAIVAGYNLAILEGSQAVLQSVETCALFCFLTVFLSINEIN